ncbi:MAG: PLP-dependent transferase [Actinomycetota bacterium]|nr:PLP-dependent transferase [Actinomycetota bacterium]
MHHDPFTAALHADDDLAESPDVAPPLRPTTTYERTDGGRIYRRDGDETTDRLEAVIGSLEGGHSVVYPSGMAAVAAVLRFVRPQRISLPDDVYHGVRAFVGTEAERGTWQLVSPDELGSGDVWWVETPSNPKCLITDLEKVATVAASRFIVTVADATFATPVLQRTLSFGIDYAIHATTKFIAGHSDAMGGVATTMDPAVAAELRDARKIDGAVPGTLETWLTLRGVRTLPLRVHRQSESALQIARFLHGRVERVWYPGLPDDPGHDLARQQMDGFGGMLSFEVTDAAAAEAVVAGLTVFTNATSLGGVESLVEHRLRSDPTAPPGLIRLSIGLESPQALIEDLKRAIQLSTGSSS